MKQFKYIDIANIGLHLSIYSFNFFTKMMSCDPISTRLEAAHSAAQASAHLLISYLQCPTLPTLTTPEHTGL